MWRLLMIVAVLAGGAYWFNVGNVRQQLDPKLKPFKGHGESAATQADEVVRWRDNNGTWVYGDVAQAPKGVKVEKVALKPLMVVPSQAPAVDSGKADSPPPAQPPKSALERMQQAVSSQ
ncbi:DUF4124 domain-containing protein [Chitinivorax sp. B]|uniref:DUF4124 domain-containing protein n=1 Tax=Chitinivorax sp. B TaxID=2502235 RepID=UPI0010F96899|nr:DUF4124 domain-containing protein [Chitinivorax sp. B]